MKKSASSTVKLREAEMKAALQLSGDSCSSSVQGSMKNMEEESTRLPANAKKKTKFRSISSLYLQCTKRLSPVEDEYNWNHPAGSNMNISTKEDSSIRTNKNNVGRKRKWRENQKGKGKKDVTTSSTSKIAKILNYPEVNSDGEIVDKTGYVSKQKFRSMVDIYEATKPVMNMKKN
ncbi:hypothetical protein A4A49_03104 [Nicotiana attenuata]|uniref:Uncharacterized protein n=1 Tax=Nicotiana attenuata TaxID=49451 RepID=A0A1J6IS28_NICAT|nr:hypothetical protein A4A49_03104 [Nicotiana attenuata]